MATDPDPDPAPETPAHPSLGYLTRRQPPGTGVPPLPATGMATGLPEGEAAAAG